MPLHPFRVLTKFKTTKVARDKKCSFLYGRIENFPVWGLSPNWEIFLKQKVPRPKLFITVKKPKNVRP